MRALFVSLTLLLVLGSPARPQDAPDDPDREANAAVEQVLSSRKATVNFPGTPLGEVVLFLQDVTGLNVVLDPELDPEQEVVLQVQDVGLRDVIDQALADTGAEARAWCGALVIVPAGKDLGAPPRFGESDAEKALARKQLTLSFDGTAMADVLDFLRDITGATIQVAPDARPLVDAASVTLSLKGVSAARALTLLTHPHGLTWRHTDAGLRLEARQDLGARLGRRVTIRGEGVEISAILAQLEADTGVAIEVVGATAKVTVGLASIPLRDALDILASMTGARWRIDGDGVVFEAK